MDELLRLVDSLRAELASQRSELAAVRVENAIARAKDAARIAGCRVPGATAGLSSSELRLTSTGLGKWV